MTLQDIVDQLNEACESLGNRAQLLRDITEIDDLDQDLPAAFVLRVSDSVSPQEGVGALVTQQRTRQFAVLLMTAPFDDAEPMEALRAEVFAALIDWDAEGYQIEYAGGESRSPVAGVDRWQERFQYTDYIRFQR
jgi:hypothetical protein